MRSAVGLLTGSGVVAGAHPAANIHREIISAASGRPPTTQDGHSARDDRVRRNRLAVQRVFGAMSADRIWSDTSIAWGDCSRLPGSWEPC